MSKDFVPIAGINSTRDAGFIMIFILNSSMLALNLKNCTFLVNQY